MKLPSIKTQLIIFLSSFAAYLSATSQDLAFLVILFVAVSAAIVTDSVITYIETKKFVVTDSSIISGIIIGYVLPAAQARWIFLAASILAIASKHIIRFNRRHLFNPAALGIFSVVILFGASVQWRGANAWYVLLPAGIYFASKIRKMAIVISYMLSFWILFGIQALVQKAPLIDAIMYQNFFFIFVMLIEPKTTPIRLRAKLIFGIAAAASIFILTEMHAKSDAELCSLLALNIFSPLLDKLS